jgi:hypothetical protein
MLSQNLAFVHMVIHYMALATTRAVTKANVHIGLKHSYARVHIFTYVGLARIVYMQRI